MYSKNGIIINKNGTTGVAIIKSEDGTVKVDTKNLPNGVQYDLSVNTDIIATKESVNEVKTNLNTLTGTVDTLSNSINNIGVWEDISSEFTPTSVITYINRAIVKINRKIKLVYFSIDINGDFYRDSSVIRQLLFKKSSAISNLTFDSAYGVYRDKSTAEYKMPYQIVGRDDGIHGWLPEPGYRASYILATGVTPFSGI